MKIALLTLGTRGDVQPFAVLGKALQQRGHDVTLSSAKNFASLADSYGLRFVPVDADFQALIDSDEGKKMMKNPFRSQQYLKTLIHPMVYNSLNTFYQVSGENDKVLFHVKTLADRFADQFPEKMMQANVVPAFEPTKEFPNPIFSSLPTPQFFNRFSFHLTALGLKMMAKPISAFRRNASLPEKHIRISLPSIYGISSYFLPKPADYPERSYYTGFWFSTSDKELDDDLSTFLENGEPPLLLTFGSMPFETRLNLFQSLKKITETYNIRLVVVKGWGMYDDKEFDGNTSIKLIQSAPYDKLMPKIKAAIHHGGIGTISSCLQAGKPFFSCPVIYPFGDQHFWGSIAYRKGVGLKPVALKNLTEDLLLKNAETLLSSDHLYSNSIQMMEHLKTEDGVLNAINLVEKHTG
jgi:sterol 3beta-glucosyltransferase